MHADQRGANEVAGELLQRLVLASEGRDLLAVNNLINVLVGLRKFDECTALCARVAGDSNPAVADIWTVCSHCFHGAGDAAMAVAYMERGVNLDRASTSRLAHYAHMLNTNGFKREADQVSAILMAQARETATHGQIDPFIVSFLDVSLAARRFVTMAHANATRTKHAADIAWALEQWGAPRMRPGLGARRVRVGYLSGVIKHHVTGHVARPLFALHDRAAFEVFVYATTPSDESPLRNAIERTTEHFFDVSRETDREIAQRIRGDQLDVLIDLNGYVEGGRSHLYAMRLAPVQMQWLVFIGTMGEPALPYVLSDPVAAPPDLRHQFTEHIVYTKLYQINDYRQQHAILQMWSPPDDVRRVGWAHAFDNLTAVAIPPELLAPGTPDERFVFCDFNSLFKVCTKTWDAWMSVLKRVPHAVLWLAEMPPSAVAGYRRAAREWGVDPSRILFSRVINVHLHMRRVQRCDLFLDTFVYNGGVTATDALFAGVPVLTLAGKQMGARMAASLLHSLDLDRELVVHSAAAFVERAVELARDTAQLAALRRLVRARTYSHRLFDTHDWMHSFEGVLRLVVEREAVAEQRRAPHARFGGAPFSLAPRPPHHHVVLRGAARAADRSAARPSVCRARCVHDDDSEQLSGVRTLLHDILEFLYGEPLNADRTALVLNTPLPQHPLLHCALCPFVGKRDVHVIEPARCAPNVSMIGPLDGRPSPLLPASFNTILAIDALSAHADPQRALVNLVHALRSGGALLLIETGVVDLPQSQSYLTFQAVQRRLAALNVHARGVRHEQMYYYFVRRDGSQHVPDAVRNAISRDVYRGVDHDRTTPVVVVRPELVCRSSRTEDIERLDVPEYFRLARTDVFALIPAAVRNVLEVGCSAGGTAEQLRAARPADELFYTCIEPHPGAAAAARAHVNKSMACLFEDCEAAIADHSIDVVLMLDVIEHMVWPEQALLLALRKLRPTGSVVISVPNVLNWDHVLGPLFHGKFEYTDFGILDRTHVRFFTVDSLVGLLRRAGFAVADMRKKPIGNGAPPAVAEALRQYVGDRVWQDVGYQLDAFQLLVRAVPANA